MTWTVLGTEAVFKAQRLVALGEVVKIGTGSFPIVWMQEPLGRLAQQIRFGPAKGSSPGRIDAEIFAVQADDHQQILRDVPYLQPLPRLGLDALFERFVETTERRLGFDAFF